LTIKKDNLYENPTACSVGEIRSFV